MLDKKEQMIKEEIKMGHCFFGGRSNKGSFSIKNFIGLIDSTFHEICYKKNPLSASLRKEENKLIIEFKLRDKEDKI